MPVTKTIDFLPAVFQTETNRKFLNATMDQLIAEPKLNRISGYVGRKFASTYKSSDSYLREPTADRANYQLEPGIVVKNKTTGEVDFHVTYPEVLQKLQYYGVDTTNQDPLWTSEYYTYNPHIDFDKFINFNQYYWLPNGPDAVDVYAGDVDLEKTYVVTSDISNSAYNISGFFSTPNPDIILARGGTYEFAVNQPGRKFWIQCAPGLSGKQTVLSNLSSREILGVTNNGIETGTVTFVVPEKTAQDFFVNLPKVRDVDLATNLKYSYLQGAMLSDLIRDHGGIDGQYTESILLGKYLIFNQTYYDDSDWTYDGAVVPPAQRYGVWRIELIEMSGDYQFDLQFVERIPVNNKVTVKTGDVNGGTDWYIDTNGEPAPVPIITANMDTLYYQDSEDSSLVGVIHLVEPNNSVIDVETEILGKTNYVSPNGVSFSNGLKIVFDASVTPTSYQNKEFYVEGIGTSITLTEVASLGDSYDTPDYIVINRSSREKSQWACGNRWFHKEIVRLTAFYNESAPVYDQEFQARRPIIEFEADLQLYDFGSNAKIPVDVYDDSIVNPFNAIEGQNILSESASGVYVDGVQLAAGTRVIFAADQDPITRNNIWEVTFIQTAGGIFAPKQVHLVLASDGEVQDGDTVYVKSGIKNSKKNFWYYNSAWNLGQEKTAINQAPLFDVFDADGVSFGDTIKYPPVTVGEFFVGSKIFGYAVGTGTPDPVLGFPLVYRNVNNIGDITFENNFDSEVFQYAIDRINYTTKINTGLLKKHNVDNSVTYLNNWSTVIRPSTQYQNISYIYDGQNNTFYVDVTPIAETKVPNLYVYVNSKQLSRRDFITETLQTGFRIFINQSKLRSQDRVDILIFSSAVSALGQFQVPDNLNLNAQNTTITALTLGELRNHTKALTTSSMAFSGPMPGANNLRDLNINNYCGTILQQTAGIPYSGIFLTDDKASFVNSVNFASQEYTKFKNKFLELAINNPDVHLMGPAQAIDSILTQMNALKNPSFPWYYSDMIPYGDSREVITYNIFNPAAKTYEITNMFSLDDITNQSVILYHNGSQMIYGIDYTFSKTSASVIISDSYPLAVDDTLEIVQFDNTDGCYVPETPTKLGVYPKFTPSMYKDTTYRGSIANITASSGQVRIDVAPWNSMIQDSEIKVTVGNNEAGFTVEKSSDRYTIVLSTPAPAGAKIKVRAPVVMVRGHDGSMTPAFDDFRDALLVELEKRIYNNIKIVYDDTKFSIYNALPGKFRNTGTTLTVFNTVLNRFFMQWAGNNRLNFMDNDTWDRNDSFTWNYRNTTDRINQENLPGSWRACFRYFYDTERPNETPWEMLGFSEKPDWWEATYGPAPYTGGNGVMWQHLQDGYIASGPRAGTDRRFTRPGLMNFIPVNEYGDLISPAGLLSLSYNIDKMNGSWSAGNIGPVENAWRNSSEYAFAVQVAVALTKPGNYFGLCINKQLLEFDTTVNQWINKNTRVRVKQQDIVVNGEADSTTGVTMRSAGYLNWIADYLRNTGIDPSVYLRNYLNNYDLRLTYRMAGYSDKSYLKILAEQYSPDSTNDSIIIPDSDYDLVLNKSAPVRKIVYSAVIIERTSTGYRVSGYDTRNPQFIVVPPETAGESYAVDIIDKSVNVFKKYRKYKVSIPYGYEFTTEQQVANFLVSYGVYLSAQGFRFDDYDPELQEVKNWILSVKEFLFWAQQGWGTNNVISLSPAGSTLKVSATTAVVDAIDNSMFGSRVLTQNFQPVGAQNLSVLRDRNQFACTVANGDAIGLAELNMVQFEHALIFNNTTMFNDVIYRPELGMRQSRLKLVGFKTADWTGNLDPQGFIWNNKTVPEWQSMKDYLKGDLVQYKGINYTASKDLSGSDTFKFSDWVKTSGSIKSGLLNNFAFNSSVSESFYDVDGVNLESNYEQFGKSLIGFKNRNYLNMLGVDDTSQVKFYQGYIKEKGTLNAFNALANIDFANIDSSVELSEEWAFRVGEYGALDIVQTVDLQLSDENILSNPFSILVGADATTGADVLVNTPYKSSSLDFTPPMFLNLTNNAITPNEIGTAGFVNAEDIDITIFDINNYADLNASIDNIGVGTKIWCAKDFDYEWNVYRVTETLTKIIKVSNALDGLVQMTTDKPHGMSADNIVLVKNAKEFSGFYKIVSAPTISTFIVAYAGDINSFTSYASLSGTLFGVKSMKYDYAYQIADYQPESGWKTTDYAWVKNNSGTNWGVYKKEEPWTFNSLLPQGGTDVDSKFGTAVNISGDTNFVLVGKPGANGGAGQLKVYAKGFDGNLRDQSSISPITSNLVGFGSSIEQGTNYAVIGAPGSASGLGYAFTVYRYRATSRAGSTVIQQPLIAPDFANIGAANFGSSVTMSEDDQWIYVGAPGANAVYAYAYVNNTITANTAITVEANTTVTTAVLSFIPESADSVVITTEDYTHLPYIDYNISGTVVTFNSPLPVGKTKFEQYPGYRFIAKMSGNAGTNFGYSVSAATDGAQICIGAPSETVGGVENAGAVYVYDRTIEAFISSGDRTTYSTQRPIGFEAKVKVNGILQGRRGTADVDYTYEINSLGQVQFNTAPNISDVIAVETNQFNLLERTTVSQTSGARLGYAVNLCPTNCSLYIGAPYFNDGTTRNSGAVYRFFNQGRTVGYTTATKENPTVIIGDSIRINDYEVIFTGTTLAAVIDDINSAGIPGVVASNSNGYLRLDCDVKLNRNRLRVLTGLGTALTDLGLIPFVEVQQIVNPYSNENEFFGKKIRITRTLPDTTLLIGSDYASTYEKTTFDGGVTYFDMTSTNALDRFTGSGAVYVYTYLNDARETVPFPAGKLAFAQQLVPTNNYLNAGDSYGYDFDLQDNLVVVGAPTESKLNPNSGQVFVFDNASRKLGWNLIREQDSIVNIESINQFYLWSKSSNTIITTLDYIDPAKGKILGTAEQEIKYKTVYDPASYNRGTNSDVDVDTLRHWSDKQTGQVWWDLDKVRFIDYEQGSIGYRNTNWGKMFPGSSVDVYEWVESLYLPSEYVTNGGNGVPKYEDDSAYVAISTIDALTNQEYNKYYYWVKDKNTVDSNQFGRNIPILAVKHLIENPRGQNVRYAAAIRDDAVSLFNCSDLIVGDDTILHVDFDTEVNSSIIHSEWALVPENNTNGMGTIPDRIFNKLIDSMSGIDAYGNSVPDPMLPVQNRYGVGIRPRQGMFIDSRAALKTFVTHINQWFLSIPLSQAFNIEELTRMEPTPPANSGAWDMSVPNIETLYYIDIITQPVGYSVLVESDSTVDNLWTIYEKTENNTWFLVRVQSYNDRPYWSYIDWYADGYSSKTVPTYTVNTNADIAALTLTSGDIVKILNDGAGKFKLIKISQTETTTVGLQHGTVKFNDNLYDLAAYGMGYGNDNFDSSRYDQNPSIEIRSMLSVLFNVVLQAQYKYQSGKIMQLLFNYIMSEQKYVDWMFKTSFISALQKLRKLNQPPVYTRDNQDFYLDYLDEIKPYRTTIREYVVDYEGVDNVNGFVSDYDVPAYYDEVLKMYRSPSGEYFQDINAIKGPQYNDWMQTYTYGIATGTDSVQVVTARRGKGYLEKPVVTITGSSIYNDAVADAVFDYSAGEVTAINVTKAGTHYMGKTTNGLPLPPKVTISGGSLPYSAEPFVLGGTAVSGHYVKTDDLRYFIVVAGGVMANYPRYNADQEVGDIVNVGPEATLEFIGEEALAYVVLTNPTVRKIKTVMTFDRFTYGSIVKTWEPNTDYYLGDIVTYNNVAYQATANFTSSATFSGNFLTKFTEQFDNANDRIQAYYSPASGLAGKSLELLQTGIDYPGVTVTGAKFSDNSFFDSGAAFDTIPFDSYEIGPDGIVEISRSLLDSLVSSEFTDGFLTPTEDTRPEGIVIDGGGDVINGNIAINTNKPSTFAGGGGYVSTYNSHAPEELLPGRVFDTLDVQVYQTVSPSVAGGAKVQGFDIEFSSYTVKEAFETYAYGNGKMFNDVLFVYSKLNGKLDKTNYTINYFDKTITMTKSLVPGDTVFIYAFNQVGQGERGQLSFEVTEEDQTEFDLKVPSDIALSILVTINGEATTDYSISTAGRNNVLVLNTAPAIGSYVYVLLCAHDTVQPYSEIHTQTSVVSAPGTSISDYTIVLDTPLGVGEPFDAQVVVELNDNRLRPATNAYYTATGSEYAFGFPTTDADITAASIPSADVQVYVDGVLQTETTDYNILAPNVSFVTPPAAGSVVVVSIKTFANYTVSADGSTILVAPRSLSQNDVFTVTSFVNHEKLGIQSQVFVGGQSYTTELPIGFDQSVIGVFDGGNFDGTTLATAYVSTFDLGKVYTNTNYLWITLDGIRLMPNYDFVVSGSLLYLAPSYIVSETSVVIVTEFGNNPLIGEISFRQFKDVTGKTECFRIARSGTTTLAADLNITDTEILVTDASALPNASVEMAIPGEVMINGERIIYYTIDRMSNTLGQIRRGVLGTGASAVHAEGSRVDDISRQQLVVSSNEVFKLATFKGNLGGDGSTISFTTTTTPGEETTLFITEAQYLGMLDLIADLGLPYSIEQLVAMTCSVYVGGTKLMYEDPRLSAPVQDYSVTLIPDTLDGDTVYRILVSTVIPPRAGVWVAIEIRTGNVWYDINIVDAVAPLGSGLANSSTDQAEFLKKELGILP